MPEKDTYRRFEIHSSSLSNVFLAPQVRFFSRFHVTKPVKSVNSRNWTGLLIQGNDPDHFILLHPSMTAGAESTIAGAELSIGVAEGHPQKYTN